jgi:hypothetical protein
MWYGRRFRKAGRTHGQAAVELALVRVEYDVTLVVPLIGAFFRGR